MADTPSSNLTEPVPETLVPGGIANVLGASQYLSPTYWISELTNLICGTNPTEWIAQQYVGDWEQASKAGGALANLAEFNTDFAADVRGATEDVAHDWTGNAADQATGYHHQLVDALNAQVDDLKDVAHQFQTMAQGVSSTTNAIKSTFEGLCDTIIAAAISAAAAAATSWTVVGGIIGGSATAAAIANGVRLWAKIIELMGTAWDIAQAFSGTVAGYLGGLRGVADHELPAGGYDHPGVNR
ncbi:hypothetical protein C1701_09255 [Actinoalloteichus sp. AHMU CJ021]|uniref:WXG100 family type VII secretion target n=2 Tax=Actinoalloteichus cyanogriseus TaxID=2893586 RepID=A0ABT1JKD5_ACTCY|nr:hypothetical protein [Actinoalloteichus caeruleus]AUS78528.1 hypothetical protein C1701_09255 [Actinoalloteichus sp. AHMU CJ021]MCP2332638.1 hypothetical protein [Actinoalloteichus caeruleus DSM 43889]